MVVSPVHFEEANAISDAEEKRGIIAVLETLGKRPYVSPTTRARAEDLRSRKFGVADAAHLAFAETTADFFISCDDILVKKCKREKISIKVLNPVEFTILEDIK